MDDKLTLTYDLNNTRMLTIDTHQDRSFIITPLIDQLLGYWLKRESSDNQLHLLHLFCRISRHVTILQHNFDGDMICLRQSPISKVFNVSPKSKHWIQTNLNYTYTNGSIWLGVHRHLPFALLEMQDDRQYITSFDVDYCLISGSLSGENVDNLHPNIVSTRNPKLFIAIFSSILKNEDDCAKLMRQYAKNKHHPLWGFNNSSTFFNVTIGFRTVRPISTTNFVMKKNYPSVLGTRQEFGESFLNGELEFDLAARTYFDATSISDFF